MFSSPSFGGAPQISRMCSNPRRWAEIIAWDLDAIQSSTVFPDLTSGFIGDRSFWAGACAHDLRHRLLSQVAEAKSEVGPSLSTDMEQASSTRSHGTSHTGPEHRLVFASLPQRPPQSKLDSAFFGNFHPGHVQSTRRLVFVTLDKLHQHRQKSLARLLMACPSSV